MFEAFDGTVGIVPRIPDLLLLFLTVSVGIDELDVALCRAVLQVGGEFRSVGQLYILLLYQAAVFEYADSLHVKVDVGDFRLDIDFIYRHGLYFVCELVDAHEAFLCFLGLGVNEVNGFAEVAGLAEFRLVLLRECVALEFLIELRLIADEVRHE